MLLLKCGAAGGDTHEKRRALRGFLQGSAAFLHPFSRLQNTKHQIFFAKCYGLAARYCCANVSSREDLLSSPVLK